MRFRPFHAAALAAGITVAVAAWTADKLLRKHARTPGPAGNVTRLRPDSGAEES